MSEKNLSPQIDDSAVNRQITLAEGMMPRFSGRTIGEVITVAMGKLGSDPEKVAQSLVDQNVFEESSDCPDPLGVARKVVARYQQYGERLRPEEKSL